MIAEIGRPPTRCYRQVPKVESSSSEDDFKIVCFRIVKHVYLDECSEKGAVTSVIQDDGLDSALVRSQARLLASWDTGYPTCDWLF